MVRQQSDKGTAAKSSIVAAVEDRDSGAVLRLLTSGASPNERNERSVPALVVAAANNDLEIVELLLAHGATVDLATDDGNTALMYAATLGHTEIVRSLLAHGASPRHSNKWMYSVLDWAQNPPNSQEVIHLLRATNGSSRAGKDISESQQGRKRPNVKIVFQGCDANPEMKKFVSEEIGRIERAFDRLKAWRIVLVAPERRHPHTGPLFNVTVEATMPSGERVVVEEHPTELEAHEDPYKPILDAFNMLRRRLAGLMP